VTKCPNGNFFSFFQFRGAANKTTQKLDAQKGSAVINAELLTDGETFIVRLSDVPISGTGATAQEAFVNMMAARSLAGALPERIERLAREQQGEEVRASIIRTTLAGLIIIGAIAGALVTAVGMAPKVARDLASGLAVATGRWLDELTPAQEEKLAQIARRLRTILTEREQEPPTQEPPQRRAPQ
jgi:hypothetical protein